MKSSTQSNIFESYLKVKNLESTENKEKTSLGFFALNIKEKFLTYKKNKEATATIAKHTSKDFINYIDTVDTNDKGLCDYPIGFQIITQQRTYILYANSRIIYTRWMDTLKQFFKEINIVVGSTTPEHSPEKGKNIFLNSNFKQIEKSPISTKTKLTNPNNNNNINNANFFSNNMSNDKITGFDDDFIQALEDTDELDPNKKGSNNKKDNFWQQSFNVESKISFNNNNIINDEIFKGDKKGEKILSSLDNNSSNNMVPSKQQEKVKKNTKMEEYNNYNEVFTVSNNDRVLLTELNEEWDQDFNEIQKIARLKGKKDLPTYKKSVELKSDMSKIIQKQPNVTQNQSMISSDNSKADTKYKSDFLLFDDPSLHIRQSVNEAYTVENLHFGIEDNNNVNLNKSIDCKENSATNIKTKKNEKLKKSQIVKEETCIEGNNSNIQKKIIENSDNSWTFSITVPVKSDN